MNSTRVINCINKNCTSPGNSLGNRECGACQTPLIYRYLWAIGKEVSKIPAGEIVADRYEVIAPQIWLDTKPGEAPAVPETLPIEVTTYAKFYSHHLHIPQVYGFTDFELDTENEVVLLENVPIDDNGKLYPAISDAWEEATPVRQVYWLWQILELWQPLLKFGMTASLLLPNNLRVQGWCVRLLELLDTGHVASLQELGEFWHPLALTAHSSIREQLQSVVRLLLQQAKLEDILLQLNHLLLSAVSELPLKFKVAGATNVGAQPKHNEDACFPNGDDSSIDDPQLARVSIVCDGIGGHEGGEVASQLAVQSVKLQVRALLTEVGVDKELIPPDLLLSQLEASLRVVNNLICNANDEQHREGKQRMGTTLVMALQVAQSIQTTMGWDAENSHELYIASIGDSRAYWITRNFCQQLTLDDDIATREARSGRVLYRKALRHQDAGALTQALGTKEAQNLHFTIQRLIVDEDGLLLLCSDGFSDNNLVERTWQSFVLPVFNGQMTLSEAVDAWIHKANLVNGHDNISLVLNYCRVSPDYLLATSPLPLHIVDSTEPEREANLVLETETNEQELEFAQPEQTLVESAEPEPAEIPINQTSTQKVRRRKPFVWLIGLILLLSASTSLGLFVWWRYSPRSFEQVCRQLPTRIRRACPGSR
ncbi:MAG: protein phosphatase 2C domain-containing protein [Calothrix sp. C42_A2020_038]|nr:protein phosphatase 2C domain-containing protein [Calothrix sp. C42_A2020_038]